MITSKNAVSTIKNPCKFGWSLCYSNVKRRNMVLWFYRDQKGRLHSGVARTSHRARLAAQRASNETID